MARLQRHRLLSIVGPGGIGKTSVALAAAEALIASFVDGVWFVDLAPLRRTVGPQCRRAGARFRDSLRCTAPGLIGALRDPGYCWCSTIATHPRSCRHPRHRHPQGHGRDPYFGNSREPLRVEGEHVQRLPPLSSGSPTDHPGAAEALAFPAVELFVERAAERLGEFELTDETAPLVAEICLKLDGIPLAIELAAARIESFGLRGLGHISTTVFAF